MGKQETLMVIQSQGTLDPEEKWRFSEKSKMVGTQNHPSHWTILVLKQLW